MKYLVDTHIQNLKCDPQCKDNEGEFPLQKASRNNHMGVASCILRATTKHIIVKGGIISPCVTLYVIGDSGTGKSTLVKALSSNSRFPGKLIPVRDVKLHTAGIIPNMLQSDVFGQVKVYDFAGHKHYYASHEEVLKQSTQPLILLTVDISTSIDKIEKQIAYWTTMITNFHPEVNSIHILIIGSHSDQVIFSLRRERENRIKNFMKTTTLNYHGFVHCDCRYSTSDNMNYLRQKIDTICTTIRRSLACQEDLSSNKMCAALMIFLQRLQPRQVAYTVSRLHTMIRTLKCLTPSLSLLRDQSLLIIACEALSSNGHLLFLPHEEATRSVIILEEAFILSKVHALLSDIKTSLAKFKDETGILSEEYLTYIILNSLKHEMEPEVTMKYLIFSQFCTKITSHQLLSYYKTEDTRTYYFFPNLTSRPRPADLLSSSEQNYTQMYTWCVKCSMKGQFFTPKFTHTLFIQLVQNDFNRQSTQFTVWKSGILLVHSSGTRSIIEVTDDSTQLDFITRSQIGHDLAIVEQRSSIISLIKSLLRKVCPSIEVTEFLPYPQDSYPNMEHTSEIPLSHVASSVTNDHDFVVAQDTVKSHVALSRLLFFESFRKMKIHIIRDIFTHQNSKQPVSPSTQTAVAEALKKQDCKELPGNLQEIAHNRQLAISYNQLYTELHKYTIFPEGNLCVSVHNTMHLYMYGIIFF